MQKHVRIVMVLLLWFISLPIWAQDIEEIADVVLKLPRTLLGQQQIVDGQLYSGKVDAIIADNDGNFENFEDGDFINFRIVSKRGDKRLTFEGTRVAFDEFVEQNADELLEILFPISLSEGLGGKDTAQNHSQQLLNSVLEQKLRRSKIGGRLEYEWFDIDEITGDAFQGIFYIDSLSSAIEGRYAALDDDVNTKAYTLGLDLHPHYRGGSESLTWSIGLNGFLTLLGSRSEAFDLGLLDFGGGVWAAAQKILGEYFLVGIGSSFLASQTHIPTFLVPDDEEVQFLVDVINERDADLNLAYGGIVGILFSDSLAINGKLIQNHSFTSTGNSGATSQTILFVGPSLYVLDSAYVDLGYKTVMGVEGITSGSIFLRGNYRW